MVTSKSTTEQVSWPVQVFRYTSGKGWESVANAGDANDENAVMATPRSGGIIEIRKFRVRIRLFGGNHNKQGDYGYASRRLDRIYCPSRSSSGTLGALVLKFRDKEQCLQFFDRLVLLNPTESKRLLNNTNPKSSSSNDTTTAATSRKRRALELSSNSNFQDQVSLKRRKCDTMSYIIRLLHDDSFLKFVDDIEETLLSTQDGATILAAMKKSPSPSTRTLV